jgi:AraC family transcriptional regulator
MRWWRDRMSDHTDMILRAIEYVEQNLTSELRLDDIADAAYCSPFYFHRLFKQIVGETPGSYIRRRRLTEAAKELKESDKRILEIAVEYGFDSQAAFTQAFKDQHSVPPGLFRRNSVSSLYSRRRFTQNDLMNYRRVRMTEARIEHREAMNLVGVACISDRDDLRDIEDIYVNLKRNIVSVENRKDKNRVYGICFRDPEYTARTGKFSYMVAVEVEDLADIPLDMAGKTLPAHEYAVFRSKDASYDDIDAVVDEMWAYSSDWIAENNVKQNRHFDYERYTEDEEGNLKYLEIYVPIIR